MKRDMPAVECLGRLDREAALEMKSGTISFGAGSWHAVCNLIPGQAAQF